MKLKSYSLESVPDTIREMRAEANLTQKELGRLIGVSEAAVSRYERGSRLISIDKYMAVVQSTGHQLQII